MKGILKRKSRECAACLKYSVIILVEKKYIKCNIWRVAVRPSYIYDARFLKVNIMSLSFPYRIYLEKASAQEMFSELAKNAP
jgi:hypothetical protein